MIHSPFIPPAWFRYGVVTLVTLMLCSCRSALPVKQEAAFPGEALTEARVLQSSFQPPSALPAIYQADRHEPPPAVRQAEYAAGLRANCPCPSCSPNCAPLNCIPQPCVESCAVQPSRDEYLCDGGDRGLPVGVREDWQLEGLDQEDTIAHYDTVDGRTIVTPSNKVCVYAPRFGVVRRMIDLHAYARYDAAGGFDHPLSLAQADENAQVSTTMAQLEPSIHRDDDSPSALRDRKKLGELGQDTGLAEFDGTLAAYANLEIIRAGVIDNEEKALLARASLAAVTWTGDQAPQVTIDYDQAQAAILDVQPGVVYHTKEPNKPRLRLIKLASKGTGQQGEEIEFTLRFDNIGNREMGNVTIVDNLTTRLEYVPDSAKSSVKADFSTQSNKGGSLILRWEIVEPLAPGEGGIIQFKCKIR